MPMHSVMSESVCTLLRYSISSRDRHKTTDTKPHPHPHPPTPPHTHIICGQSLIEPRSTPNFLATSSIANWNSGKSSFWVSSFDTPLFLLACINVSASAHATVQPAASTNRRTRSHRQTPGEKSAWRRAFLASQGRLPHPKPPRNL